MVRAMLGLLDMPGADAADALAIGLTHFQMQSSPVTQHQVIRPL
jgi:Holliday junction resolvasome RuvABC endonuclease subunit